MLLTAEHNIYSVTHRPSLSLLNAKLGKSALLHSCTRRSLNSRSTPELVCSVCGIIRYCLIPKRSDDTVGIHPVLGVLRYFSSGTKIRVVENTSRATSFITAAHATNWKAACGHRTRSLSTIASFLTSGCSSWIRSI